jgi:hypothetical protein
MIKSIKENNFFVNIKTYLYICNIIKIKKCIINLHQI